MTTYDALDGIGGPDRIDWVDLRLVPDLAEAPGRLGMTGLAGALRLRGGDVDTLLLLLEDRELAVAVRGEGIRVMRHPIVDMGVPADRAVFGAALEAVRTEVRNGRSVVVACHGGLGRTGTAVACLLVDAGLGRNEAIAFVRATRPGTIETKSQEAFVRGWGDGRDDGK